MQNIIWFSFLWFTVTTLGLLSWPIVALLFERSSDKGYSISKILGLFFIGYFSFFLSTTKILPLNSFALAMLPIIWGIINLYMLIKYKPLKELDRKQVIISEVVFFLLYAFWTYVKSHRPEIYQVERFMDFGFIKLLSNSRFLPLEDLWMSGLFLNYYYFGHLLSYLLIFFSGVSFEAGFFLVGAALFGMIGSSVFRLCVDFSNYVLKTPKTHLKYVAGVLSLYFVLFSGVYQTFFNKILDVEFWYSQAVRAITGTITEPPMYSFIESDLHAHVWGLAIGTVVLYILFAIWSQKEIKKELIYLLGFTIGLSVMTNTWDSVTLGFLIGSVLLLKVLVGKIPITNLLLNLITVIMISFLVSYLWLIFFSTPTTGLSLVRHRSDIWSWISFWGHFVSIFIIYFLILLNNIKDKWQKQGFLMVIYLVAFILIALTDVVFIKDILYDGEWERANTVFKVTTQTWLWLGFAAGPSIVWSVTIFKNKILRIIIAAVFLIIFYLTSLYPIKAIYQSHIKDREILSLDSGFNWFKNRFPDEYEAYLFLENIRKNLPMDDRKRVILEAEGESYKDTSFFSTFLGWPTVAGWYAHEWTWRGSFDSIGKRGQEVREIYTGNSWENTLFLLEKYKVDYIVISGVERARYKQYLNEEKIRSISTEIFRNETTSVYLLEN